MSGYITLRSLIVASLETLLILMKREQLLCDSLSKVRQLRIQDLERQQTDTIKRSGKLEKLSKQQTELERLQSEGLKRLITKELEKLNNHQTELESRQLKDLIRGSDNERTKGINIIN